VTLSARAGEGIDKRSQSFSRDCAGAVVDQQMIRDQVRLHARDSIKLFHCSDDLLLQGPAPGAGERQSRPLLGYGRFSR
jgi:hypothetical protein